MIPKTFTLGGIKWKVKKLKNLRTKDKNQDELLGLCDWNTGIIYLSKTDEYGQVVPDAQMEQVLYHELTHAILINMDHPLKYDEPFVQTFAALLHQFEKTKC